MVATRASHRASRNAVPGTQRRGERRTPIAAHEQGPRRCRRFGRWPATAHHAV